jgi:hypothetical protein
VSRCALAQRDGQRAAHPHRLGAPHQDLVGIHYPDATQIVLVQDNFNTHTPASLSEAFAPAEAPSRRAAR